MLAFNPYMRPSFQECFAHPFFSNLRKPELESIAPCAINLKEIDSDDVREPPTLAQLKKLVMQEVKFFKVKKETEGTTHILKPYKPYESSNGDGKGRAAE
jgi:hypothetical protein